MNTFTSEITNITNRSTRKLRLIVAMGILIMLFLEAGVQFYSNIKVAAKNTESLLEQIVENIEKNEASDKKLEAALKEEYIIRARAVSYTLEHNPKIEENIEELKRIATMMEVDEIHLFNTDGVIYNGTVPEYYGISMEEGEQISFFKSMLGDNYISLCQDMMPNTAENKEMMYAMVWRDDLSGLVQVGIEPVRLLQELHSHEISETVDMFPVLEGELIFIADAKTGVICGSTREGDIGKTIESIGYKGHSKFLNTAQIERIHSKHTICSSVEYGDYVIIASYGMWYANRGLPRGLLVVLIYLVVAAVVIFMIIQQMNIINAEKQRHYEVLRSMAGMYNSCHLVDLEKNVCSEYSSNDIIRRFLAMAEGAEAQMRVVMSATIVDEYRDRVLEFADLRTLPERMKGKKTIYCDAIGKNLGWTRISFIMLEEDENGMPKKVLYTTQDIDEQKREEERLLLTSTTDELTELFNRRAFEQDVEIGRNEGFSEDFLMISMDLNGLKTVNDSAGHAAGDELIIGAADCMRQSFGQYGKIYRVGGDEFIAILRVPKEQVEMVFTDFENRTEAWKGNLTEHLSVAYGHITGKEAKGKEYWEIEKIVDDRMYIAKKNYYATMKTEK